ncbi:MAG: GNAT family N-acetyltransferase [Ferruginibacter sp.]|nr:GNAT family N-acetyltransferase [Ferruginibacter sp.]
MIIHTTAKTSEDLTGILELQQKNLVKNISPEEASSQGYVSVVHSFEDLKKLNDEEPHQVVQSGSAIVGYILAMTKKAKTDIPLLIPMFGLFDELMFRGKPVSTFNYMVVGQVCIDTGFRGTGLFDECYQAYKKRLSTKYSFAVTAIATSNTRSARAHERMGFSELHRFTDPAGVEWSVVVWDWQLDPA